MRLIEIITNAEDKAVFDEVRKDDGVIDSWTYFSEDRHRIVKILTGDNSAKALMERCEKLPHERILIYPIEGTLPQPDEKSPEKDKIKVGKFFTVSKEELYEDMKEPVGLSLNFLIMVVLSAFVAGIGILQNSTPIIIGAMVIAPFLGPNMAMSFGTTLGDWNVIKKSVVAGSVSTAIAVVVSVLWGLFSDDVEHITRDHDISYQDIALALICGFAGVIAMISGRGATMVGVMVAVALLPPIMKSGLLLGGGYFSDAFNSFLIFSVNIVCINIAGIITFNIAGIRPKTWWEKENAKKKVKTAILLWLIALAMLAVGIYLVNYEL